MKKVSIYTTPTCMYCKMAKEFFQANNVQYEEFDVASDEAKRNEMVEMTGQMGVPVIAVADEGGQPDIVIGFDKGHLAGLLGITVA